jgi:hypothetical protein
MTFVDFIRIAMANLRWMVLLSITLAGIAFYLTRKEKKEYSSQTLINTGLVSGYNLESAGQKVDPTYTNNEMENLVALASSYETSQEVAIRLMARYLLLQNADPELILPKNFATLRIPDLVAIKKLVISDTSFENTYNNIIKYKESQEDNIVQKVLYSKHPYFGIEQIQTAKVTREGRSDQIRFKYTATDPGVCRETLIELTKVFIEKHKFMKAAQSDDVLKYFEQATQESSNILREKEDLLLAFMVKHRIINYYEQTRYIAAEKEGLDNQYFKELMALAAADSSRRKMEAELKKYVNLPEINRQLEIKRQELGQLTSQIAQLEIFHADTVTGNSRLERPTNNAYYERLVQRAEQLKAEIKSGANATYAVSRTPEGIEVKNVLEKWLSNLVETEQARAKLNVFRIRKAEFEEVYGRFAPWGSTIKRMEREIEVAERAYLENLRSYNQARLHQFNAMMSANLKIVDAPAMPTKPAPSKRMMTVIMAGLVGFLLPLIVGVVLELVDGTLKNPVRAASIIKLEVIGAFPKFPTKPKDNIDYSFIKERSLSQFLQEAKLGMRRLGVHNKKPKRIVILSTREGEGKSFVCRLSVDRLRKSGEQVLYLFPSNNTGAKHPDDVIYDVDLTFFEIKTEHQLTKSDFLPLENYDYIILELPSLLKESFPVDLVACYDAGVLVVRANRVWNSADTKMLASFKQGLTNEPRLVVNALRPETLEVSLGELPKRRSPIRTFFKRLIHLDFRGKKTI